MSLDSAIQHLLKAKRISAPSQSYAKDNPGEWAKVQAYLEGGARPTGIATEMGLGLIEVEDERREIDPPPPGKTWESEVAQLAPAPAFTPTRTLTARTPTEFNSALSSLQAGDRLDAIGFDYNGTLSIRDKALSGFAEIHATGVRLRGVPRGSAGYGLVLWNSPKIRMYGFDVTNPGGYGIAMFDAVDNELRDFKIHDCGASGIQACPSSASYPSHRACERLVVISEIWSCGLDYSHDPHAEKGTGLHGAYIGKDGSATPYPVKNSTFCFDVHDQPAGAGAQSTHMEDCIWVLRAKRLTMRSVSQVSGNAFQCFGTPILRNRFAYIETEDTQGKAFDTSNFSSSTALVSNTVEYGRAVRYCLNPRFGTAPWDSHGGVQYEDVEPPLFGPG